MASNNICVSIAVDPVVLITTECITITSAMRKHARWAHSSVSAILGGGIRPLSPNPRQINAQDNFGNRKSLNRSSYSHSGDNNKNGLAIQLGLRGKKGRSIQDNPLVAGFGRLRRELMDCKGKNA